MRNRPFGPLVIAWCLSVAGGLSAMVRYEFTPAEMATPALTWPDESTLAHETSRPTLVMFLHPRCPCSRAGLGELAILASQYPERLGIRLIFAEPEGVGPEDGFVGLWSAAQAIPGAELVRDPGGREASRFGASASGETLLYAADGRLLFHGGVTASRGHSGDNAGRDAIAAILRAATPPRRETPVFGCPLCTPNRQCRENDERCSQ